MTVVLVRPDDVFSNDGWTAVPSGTVHGVTSDTSDATYAQSTTALTGMILDIAAPSIPGGAAVKQVAVKARCRKETTSSHPTLRVRLYDYPTSLGFSDVVVTWTTPTTVQFVSTSLGAVPSDVKVQCYHLGFSVDVRVFEVYVYWTYVVTPDLTVGTPTGTYTTSNRPDVTWTPDLDSDGGDQTRYEVKVFTDAVYGGGGFDADTSTAVEESGVIASNATTWTPDEGLVDDTYRAYVRIAQTVNGELHWSDWAYSEFTINVDIPAVPDLAVTADNSNGRVQIVLDENAATADTDAWQVQVSETGTAGTFANIRTLVGSGQVTNPNPGATGTATVYYYEAPNGETRYYRARAITDHGDGLVVNSDWTATESVSWSSNDVWLKHPTQPSKNATIDVQDFNPQMRQASAGVFKPLGRPDPIVVQDNRRWESGDLAIQTSTAAKRAEIDVLLDARVALLLQFPAVAEEDDRWIAHVGAHERSRIVPKKFTGPRVDTLGWQQVAAPSDSLEEWE